MRLIADSGSTCTEWAIIGKNGAVKRIETTGVNPLFTTEEELLEVLEGELLPAVISLNGQLGVECNGIEELHFYGAGVISDSDIHFFESLFAKVLGSMKLYTYSDLFAAARALFKDEKGIAAILGTGSNSCYYNGVEIEDNVPAGGFILGDEGSGATLGRLFLSDYFKRKVPSSLREIFEQKYKISYREVVEKVYREVRPNRFLASFVPFLYDHKELPYVREMIKNAFALFLERNIKHYKYQENLTSFVGSVAYHFSDLLHEAASEQGVKIGEIVVSPMEGLILYHHYNSHSQ